MRKGGVSGTDHSVPQGRGMAQRFGNTQNPNEFGHTGQNREQARSYGRIVFNCRSGLARDAFKATCINALSQTPG